MKKSLCALLILFAGWQTIQAQDVSISCKFFASPNAAMVDDKCMMPDVKVNLDDKDAAWKFIIDNYGRKMKIV